MTRRPIPTFAACAATLLLTGLAGPALAQDSATPAQQLPDPAIVLADLQAKAATGTFGSDLPATEMLAEGCMVTFRVEDLAEDLDADLLLEVKADARQMLLANATAQVKDDETTAVVPLNSGVVTMLMTLRDPDEEKRTSFQQATTATCSAEACVGSVPGPGFVYVMHGENSEARALEVRNALAAYAQVCTQTEQTDPPAADAPPAAAD